ncbi:MAG: peptidylprolyl isomerase [Eubacteriales bacterium]|nr:peptidylprolyl isomerase [Eubacteriales bacterium]
MKYFKKSLALVLALTLIFGLVACSQDTAKKAKPEEAEAAPQADAELPADQEAAPNLDLQAAEAEEARAEFEQNLAELVEAGQAYINEPAIKIDGEEVPVHVLNFYASLASKMVNQAFQTGPFAIENRALLELASPEDEAKTQRDAIIELAEQQIKMDYVSRKAAEKADFKAPEDGSQLAAEVVGQLLGFASQSGMDADQVLTLYYGWGNDSEGLSKLIAEYFEAEQYRDFITRQQEVSDAEIKKEFKDNQDKYEVIKFRVMNFTPDASEFMDEAALAELAKADEYSEELDKKAAADLTVERSEEELKANTADRAAAMQERIKTEDDFVRLQSVYAPPQIRAQIHEHPEITLQKMRASQLPEEMKSFLSDEKRRDGDTEVIETPFGTWVVYFIEKGRDESRAFTTRHILVQPEDPSEDSAWDEAKAKAESILDEYLKGEQSEDDFAKLANEHSEDPGNQGKNGGLYEAIDAGKFVKEYEAWALDKKRESGDVEIVKTEHGYHLIYFIGLEDPLWIRECRQSLALARTKDWLDQEMEKVELEELDGLKYVLPLDGVLSK